MMKKTVICLALVGLVSMGGQAVADMNTVDQVPAATLLLPYFEVDLDGCSDSSGVTTLFSVNNASAAPQVAHVTLWTDESIPSLDFDIYLTGYDVQTLNLRDLFCNGRLPITADEDQDPEGDNIGVGISPNGNLTPDTGDEPFAGLTGPCGSVYSDPELDSLLVDHIQSWHSGGASPLFGTCAGSLYGDNVARGYITVDVVNQCNLSFPSDDGYFADGGAGLATNDNVLWGDYAYVDVENNFAQGESLVHVEAFDSVANGTWADGDYTFYGRYVGASAIDNREPLGTTYASRYVGGALFSGGTELIVWRDAKTPLSAAEAEGFSCAGDNVLAAGTPVNPPFPLNQADVVAFDEQEQAENLCAVAGSNVSPPRDGELVCFPLETQKVNLNDSIVPSASSPNPSPSFGWIFLNLNHDSSSSGGLYGSRAQSWVTTLMNAEGRFSVGFDAFQLDSASDLTNTDSGTVLIAD